MPPRRNKSTPKAVAPPSPPPAPTRRQTRAKARESAKKPSPKIIVKQPVDSDKVFISNGGGRGSLKYDGTAREEAEASDDDDAEVTPTPAGPSKGKKAVLLKADKVGGSRRVAPRPIKRKSGAVTRSKGRRLQAPKPSDSDIEIVEDGTVVKDEGYESGLPEEPTSEGDGNDGNEEEEEEEEEAEDDEDDEGVMEEGAPEVGETRSTDDDGDGDNHFVDDEAEESDGAEEGDEAMDVDEESDDDEGGDEEEESGDEEDEPTSSPLPTKISAPVHASNKKRAAVNLSDAEDQPVTRKRRTDAKGSTQKTIEAVGHTSKVSLTMRNDAGKESAKSAVPKGKEPATKRGVQRKPKHVEADFITSQAPAKVKDKSAVKAALTGKGKQKANTTEPSAEKQPELVDPSVRGCEVTEFSKQSTMLLSSYKGLEPLVNHKIAMTNEVQTANLDVISEKDQFSEDISPGHVVALISIAQIPAAGIFIAGRAPVKSLTDKIVGNGSSICPKNAPSGEAADIVFFGFVLESKIIEGRTYVGVQNQTRLLKELIILPLQQEFERSLAALSMVWGGKIITLPVTEDGGITFSTKHTNVDEDGNPTQKKSGLAGKFLAKASTAAPRDVLHPAIVRRAREGTDTVPVFNSAEHFLFSKTPTTPARLQPEEVLTQRARADPYYNSEIPQGSLVAVHSTVTSYTSQRGQKAKFMSFNLLAVQIIAFPNDA